MKIRTLDEMAEHKIRFERLQRRLARQYGFFPRKDEHGRWEIARWDDGKWDALFDDMDAEEAGEELETLMTLHGP